MNHEELVLYRSSSKPRRLDRSDENKALFFNFCYSYDVYGKLMILIDFLLALFKFEE